MLSESEQVIADRVLREELRALGVRVTPALLAEVRANVSPERSFGPGIDRDVASEDYRGDVRAWLRGRLPAQLRSTRPHRAAALAREQRKARPGKVRGTYRTCLAKRVRVFAFVVQRTLPLRDVLSGRFQRQGRIAWGKLAPEWTRGHRADPRGPEQLRHRFWEAGTDPRTRHAYLASIAAWVNVLEAALARWGPMSEETRAALKHHTDDHIRKHRERLERTRHPRRPNPRARTGRSSRPAPSKP